MVIHGHPWSSTVALVTLVDGAAVGALAAHAPRKLEQARSDFSMYDLAGDVAH